MNSPFLLIAALAALAVLYVELPVVTEAFVRYRGKKSVRCPENDQPATIEVAAKYAATTAGIGRPVVKLVRCSRWPEHEECGQECVKQI